MQVTLVPSDAYGGKNVKKSTVFEWHKQFRQSQDNYERSGCPRPHKIYEKVKKSAEYGSFR
jgi:hypothetical protein